MINDDLKHKLQAAAEKLQTGDFHCYVCNGTAHRLGVFAPNAEFSARLGRYTDGQQQIAIYGLCLSCVENHSQADLMSIVETRILREEQVN